MAKFAQIVAIDAFFSLQKRELYRELLRMRASFPDFESYAARISQESGHASEAQKQALLAILRNPTAFKEGADMDKEFQAVIRAKNLTGDQANAFAAALLEKNADCLWHIKARHNLYDTANDLMKLNRKVPPTSLLDFFITQFALAAQDSACGSFRKEFASRLRANTQGANIAPSGRGE